MKIYPKEAKQKAADNSRGVIELISEKVAVAVAFVSVFIFFIKLLFL